MSEYDDLGQWLLANKPGSPEERLSGAGVPEEIAARTERWSWRCDFGESAPTGPPFSHRSCVAIGHSRKRANPSIRSASSPKPYRQHDKVRVKSSASPNEAEHRYYAMLEQPAMAT